MASLSLHQCIADVLFYLIWLLARHTEPHASRHDGPLECELANERMSAELSAARSKFHYSAPHVALLAIFSSYAPVLLFQSVLQRCWRTLSASRDAFYFTSTGPCLIGMSSLQCTLSDLQRRCGLICANQTFIFGPFEAYPHELDSNSPMDHNIQEWYALIPF